MKYTGTIYRPPIEANSLLLQVTVGCTHNKCNFCTMYKGMSFQMETLEQIEKDLIEAKSMYSTVRRVYLLNADPFALKADKLEAIANLIITYFPEVEVITMYAAVRNIMSKTREELIRLKELRINELWVGIETGHEASLVRMNKGHGLADAYEQLERLNVAGIKHNDMYILGALGTGHNEAAAEATAKLINTTKPNLIGIATLGLFPGSGLSQMAEDGSFVPATELEVLEELKGLVSLLDVEDMMLYADHSSNTTGLRGLMPRDREEIIDRIDRIISSNTEELLNSHIKRYSM